MALLWRLRKHADYQKAYAASRKGSTRQITYFFAVRAASEPGAGSRAEAASEMATDAAAGPGLGLGLGRATGQVGAEALAGSGSMVVAAGPRVGLTVPKAVGKAHERNRIKRRMRAIVRTEVGRLRGDVDVILHPRRSTMEAEFGALRREVAEIFSRVERAMAGGEPDVPRDGGGGRFGAGRKSGSGGRGRGNGRVGQGAVTAGVGGDTRPAARVSAARGPVTNRDASVDGSTGGRG